jgi:hypothetical protein
MANSWLNRIVVRGSLSDVTEFRRSARANYDGEYLTVFTRSKRMQLSFECLNAALAAHLGSDLELALDDPFDLVVDPMRKLKRGMVELTYKFLLSDGEPKPLLIELSRIYPRLCFVLGWVDPNSDDKAGCFIYKGRSKTWRLPTSHIRAIFALVPAETDENEDEVSLAEDEAYWAIMDAVVNHWDQKAEETLVMIARNIPKQHERKRKRRPTTTKNTAKGSVAKAGLRGPPAKRALLERLSAMVKAPARTRLII